MRPFFSHLLLVSLLLLLCPLAAQADMALYDYQWTLNPGAILSDTGSSGIFLTSTNNTSGSLAGSQAIISPLVLVSSGTASSPDTFTSRAYALDINLTDTASQVSGNFTVTGVLTGTAVSGQSGWSDIVNTFTSPNHGTTGLGSNVYTVVVGLDPPTSTYPSGDGQLVIGVSVEHAPEPATLTLAGLGLLSVAAWRLPRGWRQPTA